MKKMTDLMEVQGRLIFSKNFNLETSEIYSKMKMGSVVATISIGDLGFSLLHY